MTKLEWAHKFVDKVTAGLGPLFTTDMVRCFQTSLCDGDVVSYRYCYHCPCGELHYSYCSGIFDALNEDSIDVCAADTVHQLQVHTAREEAERQKAKLAA